MSVSSSASSSSSYVLGTVVLESLTRPLQQLLHDLGVTSEVTQNLLQYKKGTSHPVLNAMLTATLGALQKKDWEGIAAKVFKPPTTILSQPSSSTATALGNYVRNSLSKSLQQLLSALGVTPDVTVTILKFKNGNSHPAFYAMILSVLTSGLTKQILKDIASTFKGKSTNFDLASALLTRLSVPLQSLLATLNITTNSLAKHFLGSQTSLEVVSMMTSLVMTGLDGERVRKILSSVKLDDDASASVQKNKFGNAFAASICENNNGLLTLFRILTPRGSNNWDILFKVFLLLYVELWKAVLS